MPFAVRPLLAGRFFFGAGGCLKMWLGAGGFTVNFSSPPPASMPAPEKKWGWEREIPVLPIWNPPDCTKPQGAANKERPLPRAYVTKKSDNATAGPPLVADQKIKPKSMSTARPTTDVHERRTRAGGRGGAAPGKQRHS